MPRKNSLKESLLQGNTHIGTWCELPCPPVVNVIANSGMDFIIIDIEHGSASYETAQNMINAALVDGCWPIIRVSNNNAPHILRVSELGAQAIMIPHVSSPEATRKAVAACLYHPEGTKGLGPYTRLHEYSPKNLPETIPQSNSETFVGVLVEGEEGLNAVPQIAEVEGLDMIYLGIYDISISLGLTGQLDHPKVLDAIERSVKSIRDKGKIAGSYAPDQKFIQMLTDLGFHFIAYSNDCNALASHFRMNSES
jgi:4-hydroxy-2-oxoheptanedioate aldolase